MTKRATFTQAELAAYPSPPLGMDEAARFLGISKRTLTDAIKSHPHYELRGRKKVFYPEHIAQLRQGMHECACNSNASMGGGMPTAPALIASATDTLSRLRIKAAQRKPGRS